MCIAIGRLRTEKNGLKDFPANMVFARDKMNLLHDSGQLTGTYLNPAAKPVFEGGSSAMASFAAASAEAPNETLRCARALRVGVL